jgi:ATP-dependent DNA ligase
MEPAPYLRAFTAAGCTFEMKVDGFRAFARSHGGKVSLICRAGSRMHGPFLEAISPLASIPGDWTLDVA